MISQKRLMQTITDLVSVKSISGTKKEVLAVYKTAEIISEIDYFIQNPDNLNIFPIENDMYNRSFITAFYKSPQKTNNTILITGHLDVVGVEDFGDLKKFAFDIQKITKKMHKLTSDENALLDLQSGDWLFGRGIADMKYGIALAIELLRWFSTQNITGNILFLGVPGEESNSEGMRAAIPYIRKLQDEGTNFKACFVTENTIPRHDKDTDKRIYLGSIGKVLPLFFCKGKESHVCDSLSNFNPNLVISEITNLMESNTDFCSPHKGEFNSPPTCLKQSDLKELYNVQTPVYSYSYYNLLVLKLDSKDLIEKLKKIAYEAFNKALSVLNESRKKYAELTNTEFYEVSFTPKILTYEELFNEVSSIHSNINVYIEKNLAKWKKYKLDLQSISPRIIKLLCKMYPYNEPLIIIGFAPPYYPSKTIDSSNNDDQNLLNIIDKTIDYAKNQLDETIEKSHFYDAISDLSYTGLNPKDDNNLIFNNMATISKLYDLPTDSLSKLNIPSIVFGGLGKDFHKNTERLHIPYSLNVVPKLYQYLIKTLFEENSS